MAHLYNFLKKLVVLLMLLTSAVTITEAFTPAPVQAASKNKKTTKKVKKNKQNTKKNNKKKKAACKLKVDDDIKSKVRKLPKPAANVFIKISTSNPDYATVLAAMQAWNDTNVFEFKQTQNPIQANIRVNNNTYGATNWGGLTEMPNVPDGYRYGS